MQNNKLLTIFIVGIFLLSFTSAFLGTYKQGEDVSVRGNLNATAVNVTIYYPNSSVVVNNQPMTQLTSDIWNYTLNHTFSLGEYIYHYCDQDGNNCKENNFNITPSGQGGTSNIVFIIFIIVLLYGITFISFFYGKNIPMTVLGGMAMLFLGVYIIQNGIIIYRDNLTNYVAYITMGIGAILSLWALLEQFDII